MEIDGRQPSGRKENAPSGGERNQLRVLTRPAITPYTNKDTQHRIRLFTPAL